MDENSKPTDGERPEHRIELARQVATFEHAAIRPLYLLNGGGVVALLAFVGRIWVENGQQHLILAGIAGAVQDFVYGLILAAVTTFFGYTQQQCFFKASGDVGDRRPLWSRAAHTTRILAYFSAIASLWCFALGTSRALSAFTGS